MARIWVLLPWKWSWVRYLLPIIVGAYVALWNLAVLQEGSLVPGLSQFVLVSLGALNLIQVVFPIIAAILLGRAWWVGHRSTPRARDVLT